MTSSEDPGFSRPLVPTPSSLTHAQHQAIQEHLAGTTAFGGLRLHDGGLVANYATTPIDPASRVAIDQAREIYSLTVTCLQVHRDTTANGHPRAHRTLNEDEDSDPSLHFGPTGLWRGPRDPRRRGNGSCLRARHPKPSRPPGPFRTRHHHRGVSASSRLSQVPPPTTSLPLENAATCRGVGRVGVVTLSGPG